MEFQEQLYRLRKQAGLSQEELSHIIGVSRQAVQKWEAGSARPDLDNLIALASHFKLSLDQLVGLTENHSSLICAKWLLFTVKNQQQRLFYPLPMAL